MRYHKHSLLSLLSAALLCGTATSLPSPWGHMLVKHSWNLDAIPDNWVLLGHPPNGTRIDLRIALKPQRENALTDALHEVSQPGHPKFRAHLSKEKVAELVAPHPETLEIVSSWLGYNGVPPSSISKTHGGGWLTVAGVPVSQANKLLGASYQLYYHAQTNETILRTAGYALPAALHMHVTSLSPTTSFASTRLLQQTSPGRSGGTTAEATNAASREPVDLLPRYNRFVTPPFLRWLYGTVSYVPEATNPGQNVLGIAGFNDEYPNQADLRTFMAEFRADATNPPPTFTSVLLNGGVRNPSEPSTGGNLDVQFGEAIAYPTPITYYTIGGSMVIAPDDGTANGDAFLEWADYLLEQPTVPQTISVGWATAETNVPREYAADVCLLFAMLGARGASVLVSSGNEGVGEGDCRDRSGNVRFYTSFPGSCPFVTTVGGTTSDSPEVANIISGGGFSTHFRIPNYQRHAVTRFLNILGTVHAGHYATEARGVPDIALQSLHYAFLVGGRVQIQSGTATATNTAAAIFSLLNDFLVSKGKDPLGFLNPWLYATHSLCFNDITLGYNQGCNSIGFPAVEGWDAVTGLGSLNFQVLLFELDTDDTDDSSSTSSGDSDNSSGDSGSG